MLQVRLALLARFYTRFDLPGTTRLMDLLGVRNDDLWRDAPARTVRGKWDGCEREIRLSNWSERLTFFLRRYYEHPPQLLLKAALRGGDSVLDVGANIGMISTLAAHLVGPAGCVIAFEPNPDCCRRIDDTLRRNALNHVVLHQCALGDERGKAVLTVPQEHTGYGALSVDEKDSATQCEQIEVEVFPGDELVARALGEIAAVKIDVEGYESHVVRGLHDSLLRWKPLVIAEVMEPHLRRAGSSGVELMDLMNAHGYAAYAVRAAKDKWFLRPRLVLRRVRDATELRQGEDNVAWVDPSGVMMRRLEGFVSG